MSETSTTSSSTGRDSSIASPSKHIAVAYPIGADTDRTSVRMDKRSSSRERSHKRNKSRGKGNERKHREMRGQNGKAANKARKGKGEFVDSVDSAISDEDVIVQEIEDREVLTKSDHATMLALPTGGHEDVQFIATRLAALERKVQDQDAIIRVLLLQNRRLKTTTSELDARLVELEEQADPRARRHMQHFPHTTKLINRIRPIPTPPKKDPVMLANQGRRSSLSATILTSSTGKDEVKSADAPPSLSSLTGNHRRVSGTMSQSKEVKDKTKVFKPKVTRGHRRSASPDTRPWTPSLSASSPEEASKIRSRVGGGSLGVHPRFLEGSRSFDKLTFASVTSGDISSRKKNRLGDPLNTPSIVVESPRSSSLKEQRRARNTNARPLSAKLKAPSVAAWSPMSAHIANSVPVLDSQRHPPGESVGVGLSTTVKQMFDPESLGHTHVSTFLDSVVAWEEEQAELELRSPRGIRQEYTDALFVDALNCRFVSASGTVDIPDTDVLGHSLYNFRDIAEACSEGSPLRMTRGKVYRSACLSRGNPSHEDLRKTLVWLRDIRRIKTIIDFRDRNEKQANAMDEVLIEQVFPTVRYGVGRSPRRFWIPMYNTGMKVKGLFWGSTSKRMKASLCKRAIHKGKDAVEKKFSSKVMGEVGLDGLNKLMLKYSGEEIRQCLQICSDADNYPIMFHCSSGKDRTGLIAMLIQKCVGLDHDSIMKDYLRSNAELREVRRFIVEENTAKGLPEVFADTPVAVMDETIDYLAEKHGGIFVYFGEIGFTQVDQHRLISNLCEY